MQHTKFKKKITNNQQFLTNWSVGKTFFPKCICSRYLALRLAGKWSKLKEQPPSPGRWSHLYQLNQDSSKSRLCCYYVLEREVVVVGGSAVKLHDATLLWKWYVGFPLSSTPLHWHVEFIVAFVVSLILCPSRTPTKKIARPYIKPCTVQTLRSNIRVIMNVLKLARSSVPNDGTVDISGALSVRTP